MLLLTGDDYRNTAWWHNRTHSGMLEDRERMGGVCVCAAVEIRRDHRDGESVSQDSIQSSQVRHYLVFESIIFLVLVLQSLSGHLIDLSAAVQ